MYTLLHGLYKYLVQKDEYFILILGLDNAGKTVLALDFTILEVMTRGTWYTFLLDLPGSGENEIYEELQGNESE